MESKNQQVGLDKLRCIEGADRFLMRFLRYPSTLDGFYPGADLGITVEDLVELFPVLAERCGVSEFEDVKLEVDGNTLKITYPDTYTPPGTDPEALCLAGNISVLFGNVTIKVAIKSSSEPVGRVLESLQILLEQEFQT